MFDRNIVLKVPRDVVSNEEMEQTTDLLGSALMSASLVEADRPKKKVVQYIEAEPGMLEDVACAGYRAARVYMYYPVGYIREIIMGPSIKMLSEPKWGLSPREQRYWAAEHRRIVAELWKKKLIKDIEHGASGNLILDMEGPVREWVLIDP